MPETILSEYRRDFGDFATIDFADEKKVESLRQQVDIDVPASKPQNRPSTQLSNVQVWPAVFFGLHAPSVLGPPGCTVAPTQLSVVHS